MEPKYAANAIIFSCLRVNNNYIDEKTLRGTLEHERYQHLFTRETGITPFTTIRDLVLEREIKKVNNAGVSYYTLCA